MSDVPTRPRRGDRLELVVERLDARGRGVGRARGTRVVARAAVPGSRVAVDVLRRRRGTVEAAVAGVLDPGPHGREPRCRHFPTCGGCAFQTLAYAAQLEELRRGVRETLAASGALGGVEVEPVLGMQNPWHYRNKMDFTFASRRWVERGEPEGVDASFALGLHLPGRHEKVLDVESCAIHFEGADALLATARSLARARELRPWDNRAHEGLLRHLVLRAGARTGHVMVNLVTADDALELVEPYAEAFVAAHPEVTTFVQSVNTRPAAIAVGERERVLFGPGVIEEEVGGLRFTISAGSFFQTNTLQAERLLAVVREEAAPAGDEVVYDLYCGAGFLGLALAGSAAEVWGFESVPSAVADARRNAERNGIERARFLQGDVLALIAGAGARPAPDVPPPDVVVLDPPRAGLHPGVVAAVAKSAARRIVYVSCNVAAAARDLPALAGAGYRLTRARPIDLFPHTPHVECVLTLDRTGGGTPE